MIHELKIEKEYFNKVAQGIKPYELRRNDRNYQVGDFLALNEVEDKPGPAKVGCMVNGNTVKMYTGRCMITQITDVYKEDKFSLLKDGAVVLTLLPCSIKAEMHRGEMNFCRGELLGPKVYDSEIISYEHRNAIKSEEA